MSDNLDKDLYAACKNGDVDTVNTAITNGATDWNQGLRGACYGGQATLANMMIERGATD